MNQRWVKADEWVSIKEVEITDCEEGIYGQDMVSFIYRGEEYTSPVVAGSRPG